MKGLCTHKKFWLLVAIIAAVAVVVGLPAAPVLAAPPAPITYPITQPDGVTTFEARTWGDEYSNGTETVDGYTVLQDPDSGYWFYAEVDNDSGQLTATDKVAGQDSPPASARGARPVVIRPQNELEMQAGVGVSSVPVLGLLISFNDRTAVGTTEANWVSNFFGATNSIKAYYNEVSYNGFTLTPAAETCGTSSNDGVTNWMNLGINHPNAGSANLTYAALQAADACVNYAAFDTNGDNVLLSNELLVIVIVAGYENSYGGTQALTPNVWGHMSGFSGAPPLDGINGFVYGQFGEWHAATYDNPGHAATIGIMVHETGHLIGWPDLYDTDQSSEGVGSWSVMGSGSWLGTIFSGDTPAHPSAWEKWYQGWLTPKQISLTTAGLQVAATTNIPQVETNKTDSVIQLLDNPNGVDWSFGQTSGTGEYFLVENRQKVGYDAALPGCGLLIWHIDETRPSDNSANADETRKLVDLEEADGLNHLDNSTNRGDTGDPYPGSSNNTTFNDTSNPNSKLYSGSASGVSVTSISACAPTMTAVFGVSTSTGTTTYLPIILQGSSTTPVPAFVTEVVNLTNVERVNAGCPAVTFNEKLYNAAQGHSQNMALLDFFDHIGKDSSSPADRVAAAGYQASAVGENIAAGYSTPAAVVAGWMGSAGHRANILNCNWKEIGVGYYYLQNDTGSENWYHYWTQVFAIPQ